MLLHGYTEAEVRELKTRLEEIENKTVLLLRLNPAHRVSVLDMVDIVYELELAPVQAIFSRTDWYDPATLDVEQITVSQILLVWDEIIVGCDEKVSNQLLLERKKVVAPVPSGDL